MKAKLNVRQERLGRERIKRSSKGAKQVNGEKSDRSSLGVLVAGACVVGAVAVGGYLLMRHHKNHQ